MSLTSQEEIYRVAGHLASMNLYGAAQLIYRLARERDAAWCKGRDAAAEEAATWGIHGLPGSTPEAAIRALESPYEQKEP